MALQEQLDVIWQETLNIVKEQLNVPTFKTWFAATTPLTIYEDTLVVSAPNSFAKDWLESRYSSLLSTALFRVMGERVKIKFTVKEGGGQVSAPVLGSDNLGQEPTVGQGPWAAPTNAVATIGPAIKQGQDKSEVAHLLNPKYTFDSFITGGGNRFAHAAALAVAEKPSHAYNPLFVYGGVGLGKTHLLQAIGHYILLHHPSLKVKYVSSEKFTNDFINSIRDKDKISGFQKKYRESDVLLVDDIQFLENKEATQEEFFHTFNTLYQADRQIVISSDRPPKNIATLESRLRSRFECGLITDIQPPDLETRIAILKKKAELDGFVLPDDVVELVASRIQSNIRELEGALTRIVAFSSLTRSKITSSLALEVLKEVFPEKKSRPITIDLIQKEVCRFFNLSKEDLISKKRQASIVYPRQVAMYLTRGLTDLSLPKIGEVFGGKDHTTVLHANFKIEELINTKREAFDQVQELTNQIKQKV